ncbi:MAG TPA: SH3 domain-containing protein [Phycisphaerae bacterium]|nr:SH3 domain-containing protein [Phycisphaerae bacterium]HNU44847.1 SH3 domain-containing protein [Phycisphaerae bacterium]
MTLAPARSPADLEQELQQALADFEQAQSLHSSDPERARQLYRSAAQRFSTVVAAGVVNGRLEYNLGNALLQAGDLGGAILHYRRAERLIPGDPHLDDNLSWARSRCLTTIRPTSQATVLRNLCFWHYDYSLARRTQVALGLYVAVWVLLLLRAFFRRRLLSVAAVLCAVGALLLGGSAAVTHRAERDTPAGVVRAFDVPVYKGPGTGYQRQFEQPLQPGVEFTLRERRGNWWRVELADGNTGWLEATTAELVPPSL